MKILILGIGNILFGDEGMGAHFAHYIDEKYCFKSEHRIDVVDGGTLAHQLIPLMIDYDQVILIDCIENEGGKFGDVYCFDFAQMPSGISWQGSAHEVETLQTLEMIRTNGDMPPVKIIGVIPRRIGSDPTFSLSSEMLQASRLMEKLLCNILKEFDPKLQIQSKEEVQLEEIAQTSFKREMKFNGF